jgi:hypothetical protein
MLQSLIVFFDSFFFRSFIFCQGASFFCSFALMQKNQKIKPGLIAPRSLASQLLPRCCSDYFLLAAVFSGSINRACVYIDFVFGRHASMQ